MASEANTDWDYIDYMEYMETRAMPISNSVTDTQLSFSPVIEVDSSNETVKDTDNEVYVFKDYL